MPFVPFRRDDLRSTSGIICGSGSFVVADHLRHCTTPTKEANQHCQAKQADFGSVVGSSVKQLVPKCYLRHCAGSLLFKTLVSLPAFLLWKAKDIPCWH